MSVFPLGFFPPTISRAFDRRRRVIGIPRRAAAQPGRRRSKSRRGKNVLEEPSFAFARTPGTTKLPQENLRRPPSSGRLKNGNSSTGSPITETSIGSIAIETFSIFPSQKSPPNYRRRRSIPSTIVETIAWEERRNLEDMYRGDVDWPTLVPRRLRAAGDLLYRARHAELP